MKKILTAMTLAIFTTLSALPVAAQLDTKKVCVDIKDKEGKPVTDPKTGKVKQSCKEVKVHKKLEGTEVPKK